MKNKLILPDRLKAVASVIPNCDTLADIGTDHAYIPIYAVMNGISKSCIASDIVNGPIKIAQENISNYMLNDRISVVKSNGLNNVDKTDVIVIAGMGGTLIGEILENDIEKAKCAKTLVLQPMSCAYELRKKLHNLGFCIEKEILAKDTNKLYNILVVKKGEQIFDTEIQYGIGKYLIDNGHPLLKDFLLHKICVLQKRIDNMKNSNNPQVSKEITDLIDSVEQLKGLIENYEKR